MIYKELDMHHFIIILTNKVKMEQNIRFMHKMKNKLFKYNVF